MTQRRCREYTKQHYALHYYLRVFLAGVGGDGLCSPTDTYRIARYQQFGLTFLLWRNDGVKGSKLFVNPRSLPEEEVDRQTEQSTRGAAQSFAMINNFSRVPIYKLFTNV